MPQPVYALNLFNVADKAEYMAYSRRPLFDKLEDLRPILK